MPDTILMQVNDPDAIVVQHSRVSIVTCRPVETGFLGDADSGGMTESRKLRRF